MENSNIKLLCSGENRGDAMRMMKEVLFSFRISGIPSTIPFHISALSDKRFLEGNYDTSFINELRPFASKMYCILRQQYYFSCQKRSIV